MIKTILGYAFVVGGSLLFAEAIPIQASIGVLCILIGFALWEAGRNE
jgi:hypothetical protein